MILVLNCGSQSIKWKVFDQELNLAEEGSCVVLNQNNFQKLLENELKRASDLQIDMIAHRIVHGGKKFINSIKITDKNLIELEKLDHLAPLHNPFNILGIKACHNIFKGIPQFAVFDTEFFKDLPEKSYTYALPKNIAKEFDFKRYGFHGISHEFVAKKGAKLIKKTFNRIKIITCHLGGGASISAIKDGKAIDTSMGFTPLEGLVMMTRPGNIDAGIVLELAKEFGIEETNEILNKESGIKGICGESEMLRILEKIRNPEEPQRRRAESPDKGRTELALDVFVYSIQKYIGSYYAILGGCDLLVFTGAIGFGSEKIRNMICKDLNILKKTKVMAIETDEELAIAEKVLSIKY